MHPSIRLPFAAVLLATTPALAEIRYIPLEQAESTRKCLLYSERLEKAEDQLRLATVAGGSALGKTTAEVNAIRTKMKFETDYYRRKAEVACAEEASIQAASESEQDAAAHSPDDPASGAALAQEQAEPTPAN